MANYKFLNVDELSTHFDGEEEMIGELVEVFEQSYPQTISELKNSIVANDFELMERSAHSLKGMVANFFAASIKDTCFTLEKMGKEQSLDGADDLIKTIEKDILELLKELKALLSA